MIIAKVVGLFAITFIGLGANKIGWLPVSASKPISEIVINIATPSMVLITMIDAERAPEKLTAIILMFLIGTAGFYATWAAGILFNRLANVPETERGVFINSLMFTNNGFMGYAVALVVFGREGLFLMVMIGCISPLFVYTIGVMNCKKDAAAINGAPARKPSIKVALKQMLNTPVFATIIGLILYFFQIPVPAPLHDMLATIGGMMTPLAMMLIGLQLAESNAKAIIGNRHTVLMTATRLLIIPVAVFLILYPFHMPALWLSIATLNFLLPAAVINVPIAAQSGANAIRAAEGTFLTTLFSMITIPVASVLLHML